MAPSNNRAANENGYNSSRVTYLATDRRPFIQTGNNKSNKLLWLVDSGATQSFLLTDGTQTPGIQLVKSSNENSQTHGIFASQRTSSTSFKFTGSGLPAITGRTSVRSQSPKNIVFDGIIGLPTLQKNRAILYFGKKQLVWDSGAQRSAHIKLDTHPISGHLILSAKVNGAPLKFIIDTGAARSVMALSSAQKSGLQLRASSSHLTGAYGGRKAASRTSNLTLSVPGSSGVYRSQFLVAELGHLTKVKGLEDIDGMIGYDFLQRHFSSIDFGRSRLNF